MAEPTDLAPDEKICPYCAETIKSAAIRCRYCQSDLPAQEASAPVAAEPAPEEPPGAEWRSPAPEEDVPEPSRTPLLSSLRLMVGLLVLCVVLAAVAAYAWSRDRDNDKVADGAITSAQARQSGLQAATTLTQKVLSYNWQTLDQDVKASEAVLAPSFRSEYAKTMAGVHDQTIKNQVQLVAKAQATSIVSAAPHKVVALVFVNQVTTAKGTSNRRLDQNRVLVTLTRDGGEWRVSKMDAF